MICPPDGLERSAYCQAEAHHAASVSFFWYTLRFQSRLSRTGRLSSALPVNALLRLDRFLNRCRPLGETRLRPRALCDVGHISHEFCESSSERLTAADYISSYKQRNSHDMPTELAYTTAESVSNANTPPQPCASLFVNVNAANSRSSFEVLPRLIESQRVAPGGNAVSSNGLPKASGILSPESR